MATEKIRQLKYRMSARPADAHEVERLPALTAQLPSGAWRLADTTFRTYKQVIHKFIRWCREGGHDVLYLGDIDALLIERYQWWLADDAGLATSTANLHRRSLKAMFRYHGRGDLAQPLKQRQVRTTPRAMPDSVFRQLMAVMVRDAALVAFIRGTGVRRQTICRLRMHNVKLWEYEGEYRFAARVVEKGDKERLVMCAEQPLIEAVRLWLHYKPKDHSDHLFTNFDDGGALHPDSVNEVFKRWQHRAKLPKGVRCSPHALRHAYAQEKLDEGMPPDIVAELMGHASPVTTLEIYAKPHASRLARAVFGDAKLPHDL